MWSHLLHSRLLHRPAACRRLLDRRPSALISVLTLMLTGAAAGAGLLPQLPVAAAHADDVTASANNLRTGWDPAEPKLAPVSGGGPVGGPTFGQIFRKHLNGQIYAQPLVVGNLLIVVTETNHVYGLNAATGAVKWSRWLGKPEPSTAMGCNDLTPFIGITSAPVYNPATRAVYLVALVNNGPSIARPHMYTYALNVATGRVLPGWPVAIKGSPVNAPADSFNPLTERQRAGLLLLGGTVYMAFASYCDFPHYAGYVAGVKISTRHLTLWTAEAGPGQDQAGIWLGGGGLLSDGPGRIFLSTGNGASPPAGPGTSPPRELGDAVVRLRVGAGGALSAADFFSPANAPTLDAENQDLGSGGPVGLPFGTRADPALLIQAGKDGRVFILNRNNLGGREQGPGGTDRVLAEAGPYAGQFGHPGVFGPVSTVSASSTPDFAYYVGKGDVLRYLRFGASASGAPTLTDVANSTTAFGYTSGSPVVTSNGNDRASPVIWEVYSAGSNGADGTLAAFAAEPPKGCVVPCQMAPIWSAPIGTAAKFTVPATTNGRVYVGTRDGNVLAFGSPDGAPLLASPVNFGPVAVGKSHGVPVIFTAAHRVRVRRIWVAEPSGSAPFKVKSVTHRLRPVRFPVVLAAGARLRVRVAFRPAQPGGVMGALQLRTRTANFPVVSASLTGQGTMPGLHASAGEVSFRAVPEGLQPAKLVTVTNDSAVSETVTSRAYPPAPFSAVLPARGKVLRPGQSVGVTVRFRSATTAPSRSSFSITTSGGHRLTVRVMGFGRRALRAVPQPGGGWRLNGSAEVSGRKLILTRGKSEQAGSAVYAVPQAAAGLTASFTATLHGAAGLTLSMLNAQSSSPSALGGRGSAFGFGGLGGVAVILATGKFPGDPSGSFAGIAVGQPGGRLRYVATTTRVPDLSAGSHRAWITVRGRRVRLYLAGKQVLTAVLSRTEIPDRVLVGFTGGTGSLTGSAWAGGVSISAGRTGGASTDIHLIRDVAIQAAG